MKLPCEEIQTVHFSEIISKDDLSGDNRELEWSRICQKPRA